MRLRDRGYSVIAVSRTRFYPPTGVMFQQVATYSDVCPPDESVLIHLAESRDIYQTEINSERFMRDNIRICDSLMAKHSGFAIYASSVVVYGDQSDCSHKPTDVLHPLTTYARSKAECEQRFLSAGGSVARLSNLYGPGMASNSVVSEILAQIPGKGPLKVRSVDPVRDFLWVDDAADAFIQVVEREAKGVFNIASGNSISVGRLAEMALEIAGESERSVVSLQNTQSVSQIHLDVSGTTNELGWRSSTTIDQGISKLIALC